ncbi:carboxypeptidase regulatory-like domain-containing protein [Myxococcus sp. K38C18041901]|uniref:carboxypeptidase regulatory-like domain-containing protein n=1 Tax=Myxococcus guangdongensis TaxID=2906760 RepID=UPI0020A74CC3|nr:carboxypeptidase regulatory-like domain-containing protein [Myxococcus guangdongensis]MCP3064019.1 carboxypeptidase regulatory-like domain-containing protein [Myxococcus guangdongensis]
MRAPGQPWLLSMLALVLAGACGGFNNGQLGEGSVRGRILGADVDVAWVGVFGESELMTRVSSDGRFELEGVPARTVELFVMASRTRAARVRAVPQGARVIDVGDIDAPPGAFITVRLRGDDGNVPEEGEVEVDGTPFDDLPVDPSTGEVRVGPLPAGCYAVEVDAKQHAKKEEQVCVREGEERLYDVVLAKVDDDDGDDDDD